MENVKFECQDGIVISGYLFRPQKTKAVIILCSATAVLKEFYIAFAQYLCENDYAVLCFDYRGIGASKPSEGLKNCTYKIEDWGIQDLTAAKEFVKSQFPGQIIIIIGHSVGGQMVGFMKNNDEISGLLSIGTTSGYWGNMRWFDCLKSRFFFEILRPISFAFYGYSASKKLKIMEDLPKNMVNKWRQWCSVPNYFFDEKYYPEIEPISNFKSLTFPIDVFYPEDDYIMTDKNAKAYWSNVLSSEKIEIVKLYLKDYKVKEIGHFGFFRRKFKQSLWPLALHSFDKFLNCP